MIFDRLAIGTANWGREYNGAKVSEDDQKRILDYCQCSGIDMIDTATAYGWDWTKVSSYFNIIVKVKSNDKVDNVIKMAHSLEDYKAIDPVCNGCSIYSPEERMYVYGGSVIQIPYSIYDRRFEPYLESMRYECNNTIHVRSIFLRGKILKEFSPQQCISFCLMNPNIDRVIIGADSYKQFKENLRPFHDMNVAEKHDINLLDCRKWET
ncbi:MAG: hypothetical protein MUO31_06855 [Thermodesulfovibrionales bacterium]|nr:hypothetical protein [Thermodesulfovibrionales bacterium]